MIKPSYQINPKIGIPFWDECDNHLVLLCCIYADVHFNINSMQFNCICKNIEHGFCKDKKCNCILSGFKEAPTTQFLLEALKKQDYTWGVQHLQNDNKDLAFLAKCIVKDLIIKE